MKRKIVIISIFVIIACIMLRLLGYVYFNIPLFLSFLVVSLMYLKSINDRYPFHRKDKGVILIEFLTIGMSISLLLRYFYFDSTVLFTLFYIPLYCSTVLLYLIYKKIDEIELKAISVLFILLILPMLISDIKYGPRTISSLWETPIIAEEGFTINLPFGFKYEQTEELSVKAFDLSRKKRYNESIFLYKKALKIEPENLKLLFDLSLTYGRVGRLDTAIFLLDKAIDIDSTFAPFFNNRGLLYYTQEKNIQAVENYEKAISLDSSIVSIRTNLALAYYYLKDYNNACESLEKAEMMGFVLKSDPTLEGMKLKQCK